MRIWPWKRTWVSKTARQKASSLDFSTIRSVAVIKHAALGDLVLTRPFLLTLRKYLPNATITLSVASNYRNGVPEDLVDRIHVVETGKQSGIRRRLSNLRELGHHDLLFDITAVSRTFWLSLLNPATLKIGFQHRFIHRFIYDLAVGRIGHRFEAENFLDQLLVLGMEYDWPLEFAMPTARQIPESPCIVYFPTASDDYKTWPEDHFIELIRTLSAKYPDYRHIVLQGLANWEQHSCRNILRQFENTPNVSLVAGGSETEALLARTSLLIANDTGIRNLAIGLGTPTVGIFLETVPFNYRPHFGLHRVVYSFDAAPPPVERVTRAATDIISQLDNQ